MNTMNRLRAVCRRFLIPFFCLLLPASLYSQGTATHSPVYNQSIDPNINGYWEYLPLDYNASSSKRFPLLIFIHGAGETGNGSDPATLNRVLRAGPPKIIHEGLFPEKFHVKGTDYSFIVISPQIKTGIADFSSIIQPSTIQNLITYAKEHYRVDPSRIYLCGLSMGGGATWQFAASSETASKELAAIAIACGAADLNNTQAQTIASSNLPVLTTHNIYDNVILVDRTINNVNLVNTAGAKVPPVSYYWNIPASGDQLHNVWTRSFEDIQPETTLGGNLRDSLGINVYEWLLQFARPELALPVKWETFSGSVAEGQVKLVWRVSGQANVEDYAVERSQDGLVWQTLSTIKMKGSSLNSVTYEFYDESPLAGSTLYRIREKDTDGTLNYSAIRQILYNAAVNVRIKLYPNPFSKDLNLQFSKEIPQSVTIDISDLTGKLISRKQYMIPPFNTGFAITEVSNLTGGVYNIRIKDENGNLLLTEQILKR